MRSRQWDAVMVVCTGRVCTKTVGFLFVKLRREARTRYEDFCEDEQEKYVACGQSDTEAPGEGFEIYVGLFPEERWCPSLATVSELRSEERRVGKASRLVSGVYRCERES